MKSEPVVPEGREGWVQSPRISWQWDHFSGARVRMQNAGTSHYWLAHAPWLWKVQWGDDTLRGPRGHLRRFQTGLAAMLACEKAAAER